MSYLHTKVHAYVPVKCQQWRPACMSFCCMNVLNKEKWNRDVENTLLANTPVISFPHISGI